MSVSLYTYYQSEDIPDLPYEDIFHSKELFCVFEKTPGYTPVMIVAYEQNQYVAHLLAEIQRDRQIIPHSFFRRCVVYGYGDYFCELEKREDVFNLMLQALLSSKLGSAFVMEFRNLKDMRFGYRCFRNNGFFPIYWLRVRNSLHDGKPIEKRMNASRLRQLRKGLRNGALVSIADTPEDVMAFSRMLWHVYSSHIRKYFPDLRFFMNMFDEWYAGKKMKIFVVRYKSKIIGGAVCLYSEENTYLWFSGGMRKTYAKLYPGVLALWYAMKDAQNNGYRHFEFMDAGLPFRKQGFRNFILQFGGKQISTRRWFRIKWGWLNRLFVKMYT